MSKLSRIPTIGERYYLGSTVVEVTNILESESLIRFRPLKDNGLITWDFNKVREKISNGTLKIKNRMDNITKLNITKESLTEKEKKLFERRCAYVDLYFSLGKQHPSRKEVEEEARKLCEKRNKQLENEIEKVPSYSAIMSWVKKYCDNQGLQNILAISDHRKGKRAKRLVHEVEKIIEKQLKLLKSSLPSVTIDDLVKTVIYEIKIRNQEGEYEHNQLKLPSPTTIYRRIRNYDYFRKLQWSKGKQIASKKMNYGGKAEYPEFIGHIVQADSTLVDTMVIDPESNLTYRPYLLILIDIYTKCIIGWDLSPVAPGSEKIARALINSITDDGDLYRCIPHILIVDNGVEFRNSVLQRMAGNLGIQIQAAPVRQPNAKAEVERPFGTLNDLIFHKSPGTTFSNVMERKYYDSEGNAIYTLEELQENFKKAIDIYHLQPNATNNRSPEINWQNAIDNESNIPRVVTKDEAITLGILTKEVNLDRGYVRLKWLRWHSPALAELDMRLRSEGLKAVLCYNPLDLTHVWVRHPRDLTVTIKCDPTNVKYQTGLSMEMHDLIRKKATETEFKNKNSDKLLEMRVALLEEFIEDAQKSKNMSKRKKAERVKNLNSQKQTDENEDYLKEKIIPEEPKKQVWDSNKNDVDDLYASLDDYEGEEL